MPSPARNRALEAAMSRYARVCRLGGQYNELPTDTLHHLTKQLAVQQVRHRLHLPSRQITNALNAASHASLSA